ncbi:MAG: hypothetical protein ABIC68_04425 [Candidatus Omnitrophota bacterium]
MAMPKVNLNALVRPKFFWLSIIILSLISLSFCILMEKEKSLRMVKETELTRMVEAKKIVEKNLTEARKEIVSKDEQIKLVLDKLEKETTARKEMEVELVSVVKEKKNLEAQIEEAIAKLPQDSKNIELEKIIIKPMTELRGEITVYNKDQAFVLIDLGEGNDLKLGDILSVYHDDVFIGKLQVEKIEENSSAAVILDPWKSVEFKEGDAVKRI